MATPVSTMSIVSSYRKAFASGNSTVNTDPTLTDTLTKPDVTADGIFSNGVGGYTFPHLMLCPYGTAANGVFEIFVFGWNGIRSGTDEASQWHPVLLCKAEVTLSATLTGVANGLVTDTQYFADEIAEPTVGTLNTDCRVYSNAANLGAMLVVDVAGCEYVQIKTKRSTAAGANALIRFGS